METRPTARDRLAPPSAFSPNSCPTAASTSTSKAPVRSARERQSLFPALKLAGIPVEDARMIRLRDRIIALGGLQAANSYTVQSFNLSLFDLLPARRHAQHSARDHAAARQAFYQIDVFLDPRHHRRACYRPRRIDPRRPGAR